MRAPNHVNVIEISAFDLLIKDVVVGIPQVRQRRERRYDLRAVRLGLAKRALYDIQERCGFGPDGFESRLIS